MSNKLSNGYDAIEFAQGMRDCKRGVPHQDKSESYTAGYGAQYQLEQINENKNGVKL